MLSREEQLEIFGYANFDAVPKAEITYGVSESCKEYCRIWAGRLESGLAEYFSYVPIEEGWSLRYLPLLIDRDDYADYAAFEKYMKKFSGGERLRMARRATEQGYFVKIFNWALHIPDIHAINTSTMTRSGGEMRGSYLRSVEEMGGAPKAYMSPPQAVCPQYWQHCFGVFAAEPGHKQGDVEVNERLIAYLTPRRYGNFMLYSMLLGHDSYLRDGIMDLLHQHIMRWVFESGAPELAGLRYIMYGGMENGGDGLFQWKRRCGFKPYRVHCRRGPNACGSAAPTV